MSVKLSIFTPTHDPRYLLDAYHSLRLQDYQNFEWVIVPNGAMKTPIPREIVKDPRVVLGTDPHTTSIGALKRHACRTCTGDAFIELDHDDMLVPGILGRIAQEIARGAGFVYSDCAVFNEGTNISWAYHPSHGWEKYPVRVYGHLFWASRAFDPVPRALCEVYYAPDHVRVWSRQAYEKTGGHNPDLVVGDDHDMVCRAYLTGLPFVHLDFCGYLYRWHPANTTKARGNIIKENQNANRQKYLQPIADEWCRRTGLACVRLHELWVEGKWKPDERLPFDDNSVGHLYAWNLLQFFAPEHQVPVMNEIYRVMAPGGIVSIQVPSEAGLYAGQDPRHKTRFNRNSFRYYTDKVFARTNPDILCRFQLVQNWEFYPSEGHQKFDLLVLQADMAALKGQRHPGQVVI